MMASPTRASSSASSARERTRRVHDGCPLLCESDRAAVAGAIGRWAPMACGGAHRVTQRGVCERIVWGMLKGGRRGGRLRAHDAHAAARAHRSAQRVVPCDGPHDEVPTTRCPRLAGAGHRGLRVGTIFLLSDSLLVVLKFESQSLCSRRGACEMKLRDRSVAVIRVTY